MNKNQNQKLFLQREILKNLQAIEAANIEGGTVNIQIPKLRIVIRQPVQSENGLSCFMDCADSDLCPRPVVKSLVSF